MIFVKSSWSCLLWLLFVLYKRKENKEYGVFVEKLKWNRNYKMNLEGNKGIFRDFTGLMRKTKY